MGWQLALFEGPQWMDLRPLSWTRPVWSLRCGARTILERAEAVVGRRAVRIGRGRVLACLPEPLQVAPDWAGGATLFLDGRWLLAPGSWQDQLNQEEACYFVDPEERVVGALWPTPPRDAPQRLQAGEALVELLGADLRRCTIAGRWLDRPWLPMLAAAEEIARDFRIGVWHSEPDPELGPGTHLAGEAFYWGPGARCAGGAFLDARSGPIIVDAAAEIGAGSIIKGPAYIGRRSQLHAARFDGGVSLGPACRLGGEVQCTVVQGYSNKYHDGFLGHAHLGAWVNLGANTTNSDLKNTYGEIQIDLGEGRIATGSNKIGCLIGDHVKTAIGTLLYTGTVVEPGSTLFAGPPVSGFVPAFVWATSRPVAVSLQRFAGVARTAMARRGRELTEAELEQLGAVFAATRTAREKYLNAQRGTGSSP